MRELDAAKNPKDKGNYTLDWNATDILVRLSKISPHFLPRPLCLMTEQADGTKHFNGTKKKLNHDILIEIYKLTGSYLHIANPYKLNAINLENKEKRNGTRNIKKRSNILKIGYMGTCKDRSNLES